MRLLRIIPLALLIALVASPAYAWMSPVMCGGGVAAAGGCNPSNDYVGDKATTDGGGANLTADMLFCISYQATCSGTLKYPYVNHDTTGTDNVKLYIYTDPSGGTGAPTGDSALVAASAEIQCATDTGGAPTCTNSTVVGGAITKDSWYFVCLVTDSTHFQYTRITTGNTLYYKSYTGSYVTAPSSLTAGSWLESVGRSRGTYVEIE